ncbi:biotin/lipoyl-binding protein, partial [Dokdonella sp.]|uniref:HlyD family secretion protein n=1 Tax=Dokdonella sp. TaxID=2291710 RepID=UPI002606D96D
MASLAFVAGCGKEPLLEGRVEFRQVNLATKYAGRLHKLHVEEGQRVEANALVAEIVSPEVEAKRMQADAQVAAAKAQQRKADDGARQQEIASARAGVTSAQAQAELARTTEGRMQRLFKEGVVPRQRLDQATAARRSADAALVAAQSTLSMAQEGAR